MLRLIATCLLFSVVPAQDPSFTAALDGAQEVPPVPTAGHGWCILRLDPFTNTVRVLLFHEGLSGPPTAALQLGSVGVSGDVILPLFATGPNEFTGTGVLAATEVAAIMAGGTYVNVHTAANPNGEIRGQIVESVSTRYTGALTGAQTVPPNPIAATGTAVAYLHEPENRIVYIVNSTGLVNVTAAQLHQAPAGFNGPVIFDLNGSNGTYRGVSDRLSAAQLAAWKANECYIDIHTAALPEGAIRAQMLRDGDEYVASLDGQQVVPPTPAGISGSASLAGAGAGTVTVQGSYSVSVIFSGGPVTSAWVRSAPPGVSGPDVFQLALTGTTISGTYTPSAAELADLRNGNWYVHVNTEFYPSGYLRGQLLPPRLPATFGEGCPGSSGVRPQIGATGFPALGSSVSIDLYGALPNSIGLFTLGASRDTSGPFPLPVTLGTIGIGSPHCYLFVDPTIVRAYAINALGCASASVSVPLTPPLHDQLFYSQWLAIDPPWIVASSALAMVIL